ncbi:hypothetical protein ACKAV7_011494 [Fusarium commune]
MAATEFTFLTVDGHGRPLEPGSRASIRSRCMKGVNVRQDSRRSRRKAPESFQDFGAVATHLDGLRRLLELPDRPQDVDGHWSAIALSIRLPKPTSCVRHHPAKYSALVDGSSRFDELLPDIAGFVKSRESVSSLKGENSSQLGGLPVADKYEPNSLDQSWKQSSSGRIRSSATWHACILIHALAQPGPKASPTEFYLTA